MSSAKGRLADKSHRRCDIPFVLFWNFSGETTENSGKIFFFSASLCDRETPLAANEPISARFASLTRLTSPSWDDGQLPHQVIAVAEARANVVEVVLVDFIDDLHVTRKHLRHHVNGPGLQAIPLKRRCWYTRTRFS